MSKAIIRYTRPEGKPIINLERPDGSENFLHICDNAAHLGEMLKTLNITEAVHARPYAGYQLADAKAYPLTSSPKIVLLPCFDWADVITDDLGRQWVRATDYFEAVDYAAAERMFMAAAEEE